MKIKYVLPLLVFMLLPVMGMCDFETDCDNFVYNDISKKVEGRTYGYGLQYTLGEKNNRGIYKSEIAGYCQRENCAAAKFGCDVGPAPLNLVSFALVLNNKEIFEELINLKNEEGETYLRYLMDRGLYNGKDKWRSNEYFLTPALISIRYGQPGILKFLIKKHDVNLFKKGWQKYLYYPDEKLRTAKDVVKKSIQAAQRNNDTRLEKCIQKVRDIVDQWYIDHANDTKMIKEAEKYNAELEEITSQKEYKLTFEPLQFEPVIPLDIFRLQSIEENLALNIDNKINAIIETIMRDFDLSALGNQVDSNQA